MKDIATILAVVLGGIGAYYKFFKGRLHIRRLELHVTGSPVCKADVTYLLVTARAKNIGLRKVDLESGRRPQLRVTTHGPSIGVEAAGLVNWDEKDGSVFKVFNADQCIEPGETLEGQFLIEIPGSEEANFAFGLQFRIRSKEEYWEVIGIATWNQDLPRD